MFLSILPKKRKSSHGLKCTDEMYAPVSAFHINIKPAIKVNEQGTKNVPALIDLALKRHHFHKAACAAQYCSYLFSTPNVSSALRPRERNQKD